MSEHQPVDINAGSINLSDTSLNDFFYDQKIFHALRIYVNKLDSVDRWAFDFGSEDSEEVKIALKDIEAIFSKHVDVLHLFPENVLYVLSHMKTSRCLYLINYLCTMNPSFLAMLEKLLIEGSAAESNQKLTNNCNVILQRLQVIDRTKLLEKVYSKSRFEYINRLMAKGAKK
ncbi:hypothetical protein [Serratia symbiotica]|uniref:type IVB secretion system protein IcmW n=1 Tax=Serratia symbiotica TaxID=138074 RepID=UPI001327788B|nr:hypothetical protein [Serratia symbiotica]QTP13343.1 hypothetical protein GPZ83_0000460 [Serratia symbiotica]